MKFTTNSIFAAAVLATFTHGSPVHSHRRPGKTMNMGKATGNAMGAAYFLTNEPTGNFIVSADISANGQLVSL
jgi:hypothetical protein